jgi:hypothetical protein
MQNSTHGARSQPLLEVTKHTVIGRTPSVVERDSSMLPTRITISPAATRLKSSQRCWSACPTSSAYVRDVPLGRKVGDLPVPVPDSGFVAKLEYLGCPQGRRRYRSDDRIYEWDSLHGELEVYNKRGRHLGVLDGVTGEEIKSAVRGRRIDV